MEVILWRVGSSSRNVSKITFSTGSSCLVKMKYTEDEILAMIAESREVCKSLRKLSMIRKAVGTHRLKELRHIRGVEKLAT